MAKFAQGNLNSILMVKNELTSFAAKGAKKTIIVGFRKRICIQSKLKIGLCLLQVAPLVGIQFVTYEITKAFLYGQGLQLPWR